MAMKEFGSTDFKLKDFKPKKPLGEIPTKKKPGVIETASTDMKARMASLRDMRKK